MSRLLKFSLINGFLLILAIGSWAWFLYGPNSPIQRSHSYDYLGRQLPESMHRMNVWIDRPNLPAAPGFDDFQGKQFGDNVTRQIELRIQFYGAVALAMPVKESLQWKRIGTLEVFGDPEKPPTRLDLYETDEGGIGFKIHGKFYKSDSSASGEFVELFRKAKADPSLKQA